MKKIVLFAVLMVLGGPIFGQITANGSTSQTTTAYTNGTPNNPIYIWCASATGTPNASLTAASPSGTGPFTFQWFYHNQTTFSWTPYSTTTGTTSTLTNMPSDAYRVQIYNSSGVLIACYTALVWNLSSTITATNTPTACNATNLNAAVSIGTLVYYNPPPASSLINASTQITVCFNATHTWVSDLAFYLVGPASCGSPTILLSPNPGAIGQGTVCNSGDNVTNLCFTTTPGANLNVCSPAPATLSGTYSSYGPASTPINWAPLIGCNAAQGGWTVQIYDCIGGDVGALTNSSISFSNLTSVCGSPTTITYNSGNINSPINDNSCSAGAASVFQVPVPTNLTTPITLSPSVSFLWTSSPSVSIPGASSSLTPSITGLPTGTTTFTFTTTISSGATTCNFSGSTSYTVNPSGPATFNALGPVCVGGTLALPGTSTNGFTGTWSPPTVNTATAGTTNYTFTPGGTQCGTAATIPITVISQNTIATGTSQTVCLNSPISTINLVTTGATGATFAGLPAGVTGSWAANTVIISGTPTVAGTFTYTVTTTGGCPPAVTTGTITVNTSNTIAAGTNQSVCLNSVITNISLATTGATGATFTGLPPGVTGSWAGNIVTISGTPTATGTFSYTITTTGGCPPGTTSGTITVITQNTIAAGANQTICLNSVMSNITLATTGATGATFSGLPAGVNGIWAGNMATISGTPTASGTFNYTVTTTGGCPPAAATGTITVNPQNTVAVGTNLTVCINSPITNITLATTGATGATFAGLPAGITGSWAANTATISGTPSASGIFNYTITTTGGCPPATATGTITVNPNVTPTFTQVAPICSGAVLASLPTTSSNGITGTWFPLVMNNTATTLYTFTPTQGLCATTATMTITVNPNVTPTFNQVAPICSGATLSALPTTSTNGITGTWSPALNNSTTTTYNFAPTGGQCSTGTSMTIVVNPNVTPTFTPVAPICAGATLSALPAMSNNGINGSWSPALNNMATTTYNFLPSGGQCALPATLTITVNPIPVVSAGNYSAVCVNAPDVALSGMPAGGTFSGSGVTGSNFDPSVGTSTITYSFTSPQGCSNTGTSVITVNPLPTINAGSDQTVCLGTNVTLSGNGGVAYVWDNGVTNGTPFSPSIGSTNYTVTGTDANGCINTDIVIVNVLQVPNAILSSDVTSGDTPLTVNFTNGSTNGTSYAWSYGNGSNETTTNLNGTSSVYTIAGTYNVTLTASNGVCSDIANITITAILPIPPVIRTPNMFSPNGDGLNDKFFFEVENVESIKVVVINRWGETVYEMNSLLDFWDGKLSNGNEASEGVYFYTYEFKALNGEIITGHDNVTLIR